MGAVCVFARDAAGGTVCVRSVISFQFGHRQAGDGPRPNFTFFHHQQAVLQRTELH